MTEIQRAALDILIECVLHLKDKGQLPIDEEDYLILNNCLWDLRVNYD